MFADSLVLLTTVYLLTRAFVTDVPRHCQNAMSAFHTASTVCCTLLIQYRPAAAGALFDYSLSLTATYFAVDTLISVTDRELWAYIPHHCVALFLAAVTGAGFTSRPLMCAYFFVIEASNMGLAPFDSAKQIPDPWVAEAVLPLYWVTYAPARALVLPLLTYAVCKDALFRGGWVHLAVAACTLAIQLLSWWYSWRLSRLLRRRSALLLEAGPRADFAGLCARLAVGEDSDRAWAIGTNVVRAMVTVGLAYAVVPGAYAVAAVLAHCCTDLVACAISTLFYLYEFPMWLERLDHAFVHAKLATTGYALSCTLGTEWSTLSLGSMVFLAVVVGWIYRPSYVPISHNKGVVSALYCGHFLLASAPFVLLPRGVAATAFGLYAAGFATWVAAVPERFANACGCSKTLTSHGWMHLAVCAADTTLVLAMCTGQT